MLEDGTIDEQLLEEVDELLEEEILEEIEIIDEFEVDIEDFDFQTIMVVNLLYLVWDALPITLILYFHFNNFKKE